VEAGLAPLSGLQVEVDHSVDGHRLVTDLVVTLHSGGTRMYEADRGTMAGHRLTARLAAYARYATHTIHVGPRHLVGRTEHYWRRRYPGQDRFPDVMVVFDGLPHDALQRRSDRLHQDARRIRAVRDGTVPVFATTIEGLRANPNTGGRLGRD
ncbi:MAG TPA: hypothetical protein VLH10_13060, partial [Yinghuangia sp.]|nr:hypothetical protein [Yinghuangia sp.]